MAIISQTGRRLRVARVLETAPGLGAIRVARLLPVVVTPHRFRTKRQFWSRGVVLAFSPARGVHSVRVAKRRIGIRARRHTTLVETTRSDATGSQVSILSGPSRRRSRTRRCLRIGCAPAKYREKRWPQEARMEGWFPTTRRTGTRSHVDRRCDQHRLEGALDLANPESSRRCGSKRRSAKLQA